ncbi:anti-sigma factor domain-containing protein [Methylobacterium sp. NPDC017609]|jgi:hypothetical protein|uniref:anti-sigma factor domain-containing protein n=1 Tax=unclassified Methylobacterium TaxID=2615210 RepID=UPI0037BBF96F
MAVAVKVVVPGWLIQFAQNGTVQSLPLADVLAGSGRALQLWTLWDQAPGPVSLGVLPPGGAIRLPPDRLEAIGDGQLFEITLEPEAASPIGRPTGRILFIGRAREALLRLCDETIRPGFPPAAFILESDPTQPSRRQRFRR